MKTWKKMILLMVNLCVGSLFVGGINIAHATAIAQQRTLDNGLNVLLIESHHVPMLAMKLILPAGSRFDADGKGGSAALLSAMMTDHTKKHDYLTWAATLDDAAIRLGVGVDQDSMSFSVMVLREAVDEGLDALAEVLLQPAWDKKRFNFIKANAISTATKAQESAGTFAGQAAAQMLFKGHPYGHPVSGDVASLKKIQLSDLKAIYKHQFKPQGATLAVSGDITMDELVKLLQPRLQPWQGAPKQALSDIKTPQISSQKEAEIHLEKHQALVEWVRLGPSRHEANYTTMMVMNHILGGGGFGSKLMEEIREKRGLVYGVYSYFTPLETQGAYTIRLQTRADQVADAEAVLGEVLQSMADGKISQDALDKSKKNLVGGFAQRMDSNAERAGLLAMMGLYHRPLDYLQNWTKSIESVTLADVKRAAKQYLQPQDWTRIVVGPVGEQSQPDGVVKP